MPIYRCKICNMESKQKSHHKKHKNTQKHADKCAIFKLELEKLSKEELNDKYNETDIMKILKKEMNQKIQRKSLKNKIIQPEGGASKDEIAKKTPLNTILWSNNENKEENIEYTKHHTKLNQIIKQCHNILYSSGAIVGNKAQTDIMKLLCMKILESQFKDEHSHIWELCNNLKVNSNMPDKNFNKFKGICSNLNNLTKYDDIFKIWKQFVDKFLSKLFPNIYYETDNTFNCNKQTTLIELIQKINELEITPEFIDAFSTTCGDIHESFRTYGGGKGAKELGQYFTPRHMIHLTFHGSGLRDFISLSNIKNIKIYDPCMGTGGFLTRLFSIIEEIPSENIYGCETEIDTIKFGQMSMLITTKNTNSNIIKCDSLCENPFINTQKFTVIATNPPFGTKMKYTDLKSVYEDKFPDSSVKFQDIYPIKTNNGACLFIQHCVYMLETGGICAIVLPDGELFEGSSKWSVKFRKWWIENINIRTILKAPSGTFEHAGVKTNIVIFTKDGPTQNIHFLETTKECNIVKDMFTISAKELEIANYSLDVGEYLMDNSEIYNVPMVTLGDVCRFERYKSLKRANYVLGEYPVIGGGRKPSGYHNEYNKDANTILCSGTGSYAGFISRYAKRVWASESFSIHSKDEHELMEDYLYLYLKTNQEYLYTKRPEGAGQPHMYPKTLSKINIPLPSLEIQQQIVNELSHIEKSIETINLRIKQLTYEKEQYKKYSRKAEINRLLKDNSENYDVPMVALGDVCEMLPTTKHCTNIGNKKGPYKFYNSSQKGCLYLDTFEVEKKSIIIGNGGQANIHIDSKFTPSKHVTVCQITSSKLNIEYCFLYIKYNIHLLSCKFSGSGLKWINRKKISKIKIPLPSQEIQQKCISIFEEKEKFIQSIDQMIQQEKEHIENLKQLAKDIISSYC